jgi:hypothetical protein
MLTPSFPASFLHSVMVRSGDGYNQDCYDELSRKVTNPNPNAVSPDHSDNPRQQ